MNYADWYTDRVDVFRATEEADGALTRHERTQVLTDIPCRVYRSSDRSPNMTQTSSNLRQESNLACGMGVDIRAGDELIIRRGAGLGRVGFESRAFAGEPSQYFEPFGAVIPGLEHQEIVLLQEERIS